MKYKLEIDTDKNKIITDERVSSNNRCWEYGFSASYGHGIGIIATSREICIKKMCKTIKQEIADLKKEIKSKENLFKALEEE